MIITRSISKRVNHFFLCICRKILNNLFRSYYWFLLWFVDQIVHIQIYFFLSLWLLRFWAGTDILLQLLLYHKFRLLLLCRIPSVEDRFEDPLPEHDIDLLGEGWFAGSRRLLWLSCLLRLCLLSSCFCCCFSSSWFRFFCRCFTL